MRSLLGEQLLVQLEARLLRKAPIRRPPTVDI
jgi:hypothetical protein